MTDTTFEIVRRILVENLSLDESSVTLEATLTDDLGADSLDAVELIMALEEEFDLTVEPAQAEGLKTVGDLVKLIETLKA